MTKTSEDLIPAIDRIYDLLEGDRLKEAIELAQSTSHPECEYVPLIGISVDGRIYRGHEGIRAWFTDLLDAVELKYAERDYRVISDDAVLVLLTMEVRGRSSQAFTTEEIGWLFEYEKGLCRRGLSFRSHAEAIAAAGAISRKEETRA